MLDYSRPSLSSTSASFHRVRQLTTVLSHERVRGDYRTTDDNRLGFDHDRKPAGGGGARTTKGGKPGITAAALGNKRPGSSTGRDESDGGEAKTPRPETTSANGESSTASSASGGDSTGEDDSAVEEEEEEGGNFDVDGNETGGGETTGIRGQPSRAESVLSPDGPVQGTPPKLECLGGR